MTKKPDLSKMPTPDLIREFTELAVQQGIAAVWLDVHRSKKLYRLTELVTEELKARGELSKLSTLFDHDDLWVRFRAAVWVKPVMPIEACAILQELKENAPQQLAAEAGMSLWIPSWIASHQTR